MNEHEIECTNPAKILELQFFITSFYSSAQVTGSPGPILHPKMA